MANFPKNQTKRNNKKKVSEEQIRRESEDVIDRQEDNESPYE